MYKKRIIVLFFLMFTVSIFNSQSALDFYNKGKMSFFEEKYEEAIYYFKKSLEINPNYSDVIIELSKVYYDLELYEYAYKYINSALRLGTNNTVLSLYTADIETKLGLYESAEKKYKSIISKDPLNISAQNGLANLYLTNNKFTLAKNILENSLKIDSDNFKALHLSAKYYEATSNNKNAVKYYLLNIEKNSLNPDSFFHYSIYNFYNKNIDSALENIKTALKIKEKTIYKKYYGKFLLHAGFGKEALSIFVEILKKDKDNHLNYYNIAQAYYILGDYENAVKSLEMALRLRDDDEVSSYFFNNILTDKFDTDSLKRKERSNLFYQKALQAKKESFFDAYLFFLKESIRLYPKTVFPRVEIAEYFLSEKLAERYINELKLAEKYSSDKSLSERINMEQKRITYKLGDDWGVEQYSIKNDIFDIPVFLIKDINNQHFNMENSFVKVFKNIFLKNIRYEPVIFDDKDYSVVEKMNLARENNSPFYIDLKIIETSTNVEVSLYLYNSISNVLLKHFTSIKSGNEKIVKLAYNIQNKLNDSIIFKARIIKISKDKALINAGRFSGIKLKDKFIILRNRNYLIEFGRANYSFGKDDIKGYGYAYRVDENITEIKFAENSFIRDIDIDDIIIFKK